MKPLQSLVRKGFLQKLPQPIKAPFKLLLNRDQLYDMELLHLGLDVIRPSDTFLCSYPKSGNTWLRFLMANLLAESVEVSILNIDDYVAEIEDHSDRLNGMAARPIMKTHWHYFARFPKFLYIYRDPRDVLISLYHYSSNNGKFIGTRSEFIRAVTEAPAKDWDWDKHVGGALAEHRKRSADVCLVRYEDLVERTEEGVGKIARFLGLERSSCQVQKTIENCRFDKLKRMESDQAAQGRLDSQHPALGFFRVGKANQWVTQLSEEEQVWINKRFGEVMVEAGYTL